VISRGRICVDISTGKRVYCNYCQKQMTILLALWMGKMEIDDMKEYNDSISSLSKTLWKGYERHHFLYEDRVAIVVLPKISATGNTWVWRTEFFDAFPSVDKAEAVAKAGVPVIVVAGDFDTADPFWRTR
jgi:hypothetical protein